MSTERDDGELRGQFQRLRRQDEGLARPFSPSGQAARPRPGTRRHGRLRHLAAAAAIGLAVAAGLGALLWPPPRLTEPSAAAAIARLSQWRAPTDSLLQTPGSQLMRSVPRLGASPLGGNLLRRP